MRQLEPDVLLPGPGRWNPRKFYGKQHEGREYFEELIRFMCQGPSIAMLLKSGPPRGDAIGRWRELMGPWKDRVEGTIRGDLMLPSCRPMDNLVHGSDSLDSFVWEYGCLEDVL
jgi:nucleoside diphosphate kinase